MNEYRQKNGLDELAISKSLTQTAQQHLTDLHENEPDAGEDCSQHSWGEFSEAYWGEWLHVSEYPSEENLAVEILELKKDFNEDEKEEDVPENSPDRYWEMRLKHKESMRVIKTTEVKSMMHKFVTRTIVVIMAVLTLAMILPPAHAEAGGFTLENATVGESLPAGTVVGRLVAVDAGCLSSHLCPDSRHGGE